MFVCLDLFLVSFLGLSHIPSLSILDYENTSYMMFVYDYVKII